MTNPSATIISLTMLLAPALTDAAQHALLIGVSDYADSRIPDLEGPIHDVTALQSTLMDNWQFDPANITTLINREASETAILNALDTLLTNTQADDDIIIYFSGHGTSASDPDLGSRLALPDGSGAIVASDFDPDRLNRQFLHTPVNDGLLVGRYELKPRLQKLDENRNVLVMFDACFTGNSARALPSPYTPKNTRQLSLLGKLTSMFTHPSPAGSSTDEALRASAEEQKKTSTAISSLDNNQSRIPDDNSFAYKNTVYFGAAAENQLAVDFSQAEIDAGLVSSIDGKPHGGFTDALLRALSLSPGNTLENRASPSTAKAAKDTNTTINKTTTTTTGTGTSTSTGTGTVIELSYARLFSRVVNQFNTHCTACGHTPVSLPPISDDNAQLLSRSILSTQGIQTEFIATSADHGSLTDSDSLILAMPETGYALLNQWQPVKRSVVLHKDLLAKGVHTSPDITLVENNGSLQARAVDGQTITEFPATLTTDHLQDWVDAQQWMKRRRQADLVLEQGKLRVDFRHPLYGNEVTQGDFLHFTILSEQDISLLMLTMNAQGQLSILYPASPREAQTVLPANVPLRIPSLNDLQLQVTPPWGIDVVLFYALPVNHTLRTDLLELAQSGTVALNDPRLIEFDKTLNSGAVDYSASSIRIIANESP